MGRGGRNKARAGNGQATRRNGGAARQTHELLKPHSFFIRMWQNRMDRALAANPKATIQEQMVVRVRALKDLTYNSDQQRKMIKAAQDAGKLLEELEGRNDPEAKRLRHEAERLRTAAREMFLLANYGAITNAVRAQANQLDSEQGTSAIEMLRQEAFMEVMTKAIDRYDFSQPVKPLTYAQNWVRAAVSRVAEEGRLVRLKSKAHRLGQQVEQEIKRVHDSEGREPTIAELAERLEVSEEKVREVLPFAERNRYVRLDKTAMTNEGGGGTVGSFIEDEEQNIEERVVDNEMQKQVREAVASLDSPLYRRVLEMGFGIGGRERVEQKAMFDGVYRDAEGNAYSSEDTIIKDRAKAGEKVAKMSQRQLNKMFEDGELVFEPGTPEAHELARVAKGNFDPAAEFDQFLTRETGVPMTSGTVQDTFKKALSAAASNERLQQLGLRYRGDNELENSHSARQVVIKHLLGAGVVNETEAAKLDRIRTASGGKSKLRQLAEEHGLVDPQTGRVNLSALSTSAVSA